MVLSMRRFEVESAAVAQIRVLRFGSCKGQTVL